MDALTLRRFAHRTHRWLGFVIGLQVFVWLLGGLVMTVLPIERVRGEHKIAEAAADGIDPSDVLSLEGVVDAAGTGSVSWAQLGRHLGRPAWRLETAGGQRVLIDAGTGARLSPLDAAAAAAVARADYAGSGELVTTRRLTDPPAEYGRAGPVWQVVFGDVDRTTLYVTEDTGEVAARRGRTWRTFDLAWRLHVMDYDDGADFNHPLVQAAAGTGVLFALSGLILVALRLHRAGRPRRTFGATVRASDGLGEGGTERF